MLVTVLSVCLILLAAAYFYLKIQSGQKRILAKQTALTHLPCFAGTRFGSNQQKFGDFEFWSDTQTTFVVALKGNACGIIGCRLVGSTMLISQLQGIKGANFCGRKVGDYLLSCAEEIAEVLECTQIRVLRAESNIYFEPPSFEPQEKFRELMQHQARLKEVYDAAAKRLGFKIDPFSKWHSKVLPA